MVWNHGILWLSIYWEFHNPNWRTPPFFRGVGIPPTRVWRRSPAVCFTNFVTFFVWSVDGGKILHELVDGKSPIGIPMCHRLVQNGLSIHRTTTKNRVFLGFKIYETWDIMSILMGIFHRYSHDFPWNHHFSQHTRSAEQFSPQDMS